VTTKSQKEVSRWRERVKNLESDGRRMRAALEDAQEDIRKLKAKVGVLCHTITRTTVQGTNTIRVWS